MLAAGTNVQWLRDDLGLIASSDESHEVAAQCVDSGGVMYVPAPLGLGTPEWDYGARGALFGLDARQRPGRDRARGARRDRATRRGSRRRGRSRRGHRDPGAAGRRRHDRQPNVRPGARRRRAEAGRDLTHAGSDRARRRAHGRARARSSQGRRRARADVDARAPASSRRASSIVRSGATQWSGRRAGSRSCQESISEGCTRASASTRDAIKPTVAAPPPTSDDKARASGQPGRDQRDDAVDCVGNCAHADPFRTHGVLFHRRDRADAEHEIAHADEPEQGLRHGRRAGGAEQRPSDDAGEQQHDEAVDRAAPRDHRARSCECRGPSGRI